MSDTTAKNPLGQSSIYPSVYDANLLFPISRSRSRERLTLAHTRDFFGVDLWTAYEISWLNAKGKPQVATAEFKFDCKSSHIIESKSFKLYLNSFNQTRFDSVDQVKEILCRDLSRASGCEVSLSLWSIKENALAIDQNYTATLLDQLDIEVQVYHPDPNLLRLCQESDKPSVKENLVSHLLKTNCPVTGQPDWASVFIEYQGAPINHESLLRYIISFREHQDFHEHCIERIFFDLLERCNPQTLTVYGRYTRRGGLDINPFRSTEENAQPCVGRLVRQ